MRLNLGCGMEKIEGFVNIDINPAFKPDLVHDLCKPLPYEPESVDEVVMYHCIEHIPKRQHHPIFLNVHRILKPKGIFTISYPEFTKCIRNWETNFQGNKEFWEATIYGAQRTKDDYHVCIIHSDDLSLALINAGFEILKVIPEPDQIFNTVMKVTKSSILTYEEVLAKSCQQEMK